MNPLHPFSSNEFLHWLSRSHETTPLGMFLKTELGEDWREFYASFINGQQIINFFPKGRVKLQRHEKGQQTTAFNPGILFI